jgi:hypothetical protein
MGAEEQSSRSEYRPELIPRRGEFIAWVMTLIALSGWLILGVLGVQVHLSLKVFGIFFTFAALAISLGNWTDRRTRLRLEPEGVFFENGLRKVYLPWGEIRLVEVIPTSWGKKVRVVGDTNHFEFRTLGEVVLKGQIKGRLGFEQGDQILSQILEQAHLKVASRPEEGYDSYSRD